MDINSINKHIDKTHNKDIEESLNDINLLPELLSQKSVKKIEKELIELFEKHNTQNTELIQEILIKSIPPGTKGVIRGCKFNDIIKKIIENIKSIKNDDFIYKFEEKHPLFPTDEIPDWYIYQKSTNIILVGMNQIDLWTGGHQTNRGSKYILNEKLHNENMKYLSVVCNYYKIKERSTSKILRFFQIGFDEKRLCYPNELEKNIQSYFKITPEKRVVKYSVKINKLKNL